MSLSLLIIVVLLIIAVGFVVIYNRLISNRNRVDAAWSDIDVQLKRRYELLPRLVDVVKTYASHEKSVFTAVAALRNKAQSLTQPAEKAPVETELSEQCLRLMALVEEYPDLKANQNFIELQNDLVETEDFIQHARRYYNGSVREYNNSIEVFPNLIVAKFIRFSRRQFFEAEPATKQEIKL